MNYTKLKLRRVAQLIPKEDMQLFVQNVEQLCIETGLKGESERSSRSLYMTIEDDSSVKSLAKRCYGASVKTLLAMLSRAYILKQKGLLTPEPKSFLKLYVDMATVSGDRPGYRMTMVTRRDGATYVQENHVDSSRFLVVYYAIAYMHLTSSDIISETRRWIQLANKIMEPYKEGASASVFKEFLLRRIQEDLIENYRKAQIYRDSVLADHTISFSRAVGDIFDDERGCLWLDANHIERRNVLLSYGFTLDIGLPNHDFRNRFLRHMRDLDKSEWDFNRLHEMFGEEPTTGWADHKKDFRDLAYAVSILGAIKSLYVNDEVLADSLGEALSEAFLFDLSSTKRGFKKKD